MWIRTVGGTHIHTLGEFRTIYAWEDGSFGWRVDVVYEHKPTLGIAERLTQEEATALVGKLLSALAGGQAAFDAHQWLKDHKGQVA